ncbi:MAG: anthranilate synthase component I [Actinomycetota bacterium]|nr:MAG: anthranilate synthase component I [Actinomycetota bacterium]
MAATFTGDATPDLPAFRALAGRRRVIPVVRRLLADGETPVGLYRKLAGERAGTFLLESAENGRTWSRYSFVGVRCPAMLTAVDGQATWIGTPPAGVPTGGDPLEALRDTVSLLHTERLAGLPPLTSGMVGLLAYDAVRRWERLPDNNPDELAIPEVALLLAADLAVLDHSDGSVLLVANVIDANVSDTNVSGADGNADRNSDGSGTADPAAVDAAWRDAVARLDRMQRDLAQPAGSTVAAYDPDAAADVTARTERAAYLAGVERSREYIRAGDAFQIVLSQRFEAPCPASALDVYRILRVTNPSPYMYLLRIPVAGTAADGGVPAQVGFDVVGSSPEALVTVTDGQAVMHPIAGSRPRGATEAEDAALADQLLADAKELAEHLMLVDLGRNDLGRVCAAGSVEVAAFMEIERYSHIMHIVSTVVGRLAPGRTAYDALAATFPAGTLSGAPKVRAMQIIDELEPARRGLYGGVVGYLDFAGDLDTAIAIRTAVIRDGVAYVQAGAGIVADSDPATEDQECRAKAAAVLRAVAVAATLRSPGGGG